MSFVNDVSDSSTMSSVPPEASKQEATNSESSGKEKPELHDPPLSREEVKAQREAKKAAKAARKNKSLAQDSSDGASVSQAKAPKGNSV